MKPPALFLLDPPILDQVYGGEARVRIEKVLDMVAPPQPAGRHADLGPAAGGVRAIVSSWGMPRMTAGFLDRFPSLEIVFYGAGSVRDIVTADSWGRGIRVVSASAANAIPTAEYAFAAIVLGLKQAWQHSARILRERAYVRETETLAGAYRSTVGLLALGRIGRLVAQRLRSLEVKVMAYDPVVPPAVARELGVELRPLDEVFARADVVSCHLPMLPVTVGLLGARHFRMMKRGATFINTARGAIVVEPELVRVLQERPDLFAVLDVTHPEPPPPDSPLFALPNVFLTPHIAGSVGRECRRLGLAIAEDVERFVDGDTVVHEITREQAATLA